MPILDDIGGFFRNLRAYAFGRGLLSAGVIAASWLSSGTLFPLAVAVAGLAMTAYTRIRTQHQYEQQMVDMYRDDIAEHLGIAPEQVTRANLREAASGNDILDQALKRQRSKSMVSLVTAGIAAAATFGLVSFGLPKILGDFFTSFDAIGNGTLGHILKYASTSIIAGVSSLILHDGAEALIGHRTGLSKAAAHDRIVEMERGMARGWGISKEQVYGVLVAGNTDLQQMVQQRFGKDYGAMQIKEQQAVLRTIGVANDMQQVAEEINAGRMRPTHLAYMIADATAPIRPPVVAQPSEPARTRNFVQSIGGPRQAHSSYTAQIDAERAMATELTR